MKFKKGDSIKVVIGKDKGKTGKIEKLLAKEGKAIILGINEFKRHIKGRASKDESEIRTITKPIALAKLAFICPKCNLQARVGFKMENGKKVRYCKKCGKEI